MKFFKQNHSKEYNMKINFANEFILKMVFDYLKTCVYQLIVYENDSNDTNIIQYFIMHGLGLCIRLDNFVAHMFYAWTFIYNTAVPIAINKNKYFISLNTGTTLFYWGAGNSNKNIT